MSVAAAACSAQGPVEYVDGQCLIAGVPATLGQVETRQAELTQHILSRQPVLTGIAVAAVLVAGAGYIQRIFTLLAARRAQSQSFAERLRARIERYRAHPLRYMLLIGGTLGLIAAAGIAYVSLDADKRASERALATLQFCHLALRSASEQHVLAEQREHLAAIQSSEHDIRALVDQLPPAEQQKAKAIAEQLSTSLGQQRAMVAQFAAHADDAAKAVADQQAAVQRDLSKLDGEVVDLKSLTSIPAAVRDIGARQDALGGALAACNAKVDALAKSVDAVKQALDALATKPAPACVPAAPPPIPAAAPPPTTKAASSAPPSTPPIPDAGA